MTRTIQIHPLSLLVGVGFALLGVVAMAQMPAAKRPAAAHDSGLLQVAHPRDWVVIPQGQPYAVPAGKILVITALGSSSYNGEVCYLDIDNVIAVEALPFAGIGGTFDTPTMKPVPLGLRATSGQVVEPRQVSNVHARAWGYLVDA